MRYAQHITRLAIFGRNTGGEWRPRESALASMDTTNARHAASGIAWVTGARQRAPVPAALRAKMICRIKPFSADS
jgi:hypothetical protein